MYRSTARPRRRVRQVADRTQQVPRRHRRVEDVVGVADAVAVAVLAPVHPRPRQELHRPDGPIAHGVAVPLAAVTVPDDRRPRHRPVEHGTHDPAPGVPLLVDAAAEDVPGLDPPDAGEKPPTEVTGRLARRQGRPPPSGMRRGRSPGCRWVRRSRPPSPDSATTASASTAAVSTGALAAPSTSAVPDGPRSAGGAVTKVRLGARSSIDGRQVDLGAGGKQHRRGRRRHRGRRREPHTGPRRRPGGRAHRGSRRGGPAGAPHGPSGWTTCRRGARGGAGQPARRPRGPARSAQPSPASG